ncbi:sigma-70 family RNA polymerase sigma factor [Leucobacter viscericola]|uniref:Sigma-70 family RNA polymerase sigma factor n=1 Tax=Leucobacter viscericola TaxID=2714935 RepID=A0A6G7XFR2_9MICO|nr:sigma-70 family RNA polymerase sigma factor [Leucobacter viscericola]QIK63279.1 sigma-70 family RNA polymerase sigma factor [Leucobacter viscericola]
MPNPLGEHLITSNDAGFISDIDLLTLVREGDQDAYAQLYQRHCGAALSVAKKWARSLSEAEDLVANAFTSILSAIRTGSGPTSMFRAYLYSTIRNAAYSTAATERRYVDIDEWDESLIPAAEFAPELEPEETELVRAAFSGLTPEDKEILWCTEVENRTVSSASDILGLSKPVAYRALRTAKEHLREEYLRVHISTSAERDDECRSVSKLLPRYIRGTVRPTTKRIVSNHVSHCVYCTAATAELRDVNRGIHGVIAPIILGAGVLGALGWAGARPAQAAQGSAGRFLAASRVGARPALLIGVGIAAVIALGAVTTQAIVSDQQQDPGVTIAAANNIPDPEPTPVIPSDQSSHSDSQSQTDSATTPAPDPDSSTTNDQGDDSGTDGSGTTDPPPPVNIDDTIAYLDTDASLLQNGQGTAVIRFHNPTGRTLTGIVVTVTLDSRATLVPPGSQQSGNVQYAGVSDHVVSTTVGTLAPDSSGQLRIAFTSAMDASDLRVAINSNIAELGEQKSVSLLRIV